MEQNMVTKLQQISKVSKLIKNKTNQIFFEKVCFDVAKVLRVCYTTYSMLCRCC